uniref:Putative aspartyl/asparaginyl beta-hydroxylase n=1 Tax=uncultured bacterium B7P37metaSE TaxID=670783 RepID=C8CIJ9_9BACT|nr:putative aspartyl/asparaginyl beta-hydroxylase [uncultured bacterium B7P37metaSE]
MENVAYLLLRLPNALYRTSMPWRSRPVVYPHVEAICPQLRQLEVAYPKIKQEYLAIRDKLDRIPRYHEVDRLQYEISGSSSASKNWKVFFLEAMGRKAKRHRQCCPATAAAIDQIPGVFQAFFSILEGGKSIPPHSSPYWGYLRYHLALEVPSEGPQPRMRVKNQWLEWQEGKGFLFDDSFDHELVNENPHLRSVLIVDIARPMGRLARAVHAALLFIMGQTYGRWVLRRSAA